MKGLLSLNGCLRARPPGGAPIPLNYLSIMFVGYIADRLEESSRLPFRHKNLVWTPTQHHKRSQSVYMNRIFMLFALCGYLTWIIFPSHTAYKLSESFPDGWWRRLYVFFKDKWRNFLGKMFRFSFVFIGYGQKLLFRMRSKYFNNIITTYMPNQFVRPLVEKQIWKLFNTHNKTYQSLS